MPKWSSIEYLSLLVPSYSIFHHSLVSKPGLLLHLNLISTPVSLASSMTSVQTSSMDSFSRLPTLVLTNILGQIQSDEDLFSLIRASPQSLRVYVRCRCTVARQRFARFLDLDTDGTMLQDALAIINFPRIDDNSPIPLPVMSEWFDTLNTRSFNHRHSIDSLYPFFTRLVVFIEDYLAKSLDPFPARACMTLPTIGRFVPSMQFKGKETDIKPVSFGMFPAHTQRRLLRAFIRYEMRCKIYDPRVWGPLQETSYADLVDQLNEKLTLSNREELHCVFEYLKGMYSALSAQCHDDHWFPDRPVAKAPVTDRQRIYSQPDLPSARDFGLLFPDNLYFTLDHHSTRPSPHVTKWETLACLGLDLLSAILQTRPLDDSIFLDDHLGVENIIRYRPDDYTWIMQWCFARNHRLRATESMLEDWQERLMNYGSHLTRPHRTIYRDIGIEQIKQQYRLQALQWNIYRQRGWIFFTDAPDHQPSLPSSGDIAEEHDSVSDWMCLRQEKQRRRSQKWQDYWAGRTLEDPLDPDSPTNQSKPIRRRLDPGVSVLSTVPRFFSSRTAC